MNRLGMLLAIALLCFVEGVFASYSENPAAQAFIEMMVAEHQFDRAELEGLFTEATKKDSIIDAMNRPAEKTKPWFEYREIFLNEKRIGLGVEFWLNNRDTLDRAYQVYGVNPEIVVAIIGVETYYGRNMGSFRVIDALSTLAFDYPKRSVFFTKQLEHFLLLAREQRKSPLDLKGSYAGAMGYGQFIPSSYRAYAVDFDEDSVADIWQNSVDAIGSVANYFAQHGWQKDGRVVLASTKPGTSEVEMNKLKLAYTLKELQALGMAAAEQVSGSTKALPIELDMEDGQTYWIGLQNFYTITRYNHSHLYAMAVYELSELIKERLGE